MSFLTTSDLSQTNVKYGTTRKVRRRPAKFIAKYDVREVKRSRSVLPSKEQQGKKAESSKVPSHWSRMSPEIQYKRVPLASLSDEFKQVEKHFRKSIKRSVTVIGIERVQNPFMWEKYQRKKENMSASKNGCAKQTFVNERQLFHGTNPEIVEAICKQNFDWRLHGKNATKYGQGSYFAVNSSYSNAYAKKDHNSSRFMFVAKVLVGSYAAGDSSYRRPPRKDPTNPASDLYDSCVDDESFPTIFVVFDTDQFYPEYIIEYSVDSQTAQQPVATRVSAPVTKWVHGGYQQPVATQVPGGYQQPAATQVPAPKVTVAPAAASKPQVTQTHTSGSSSPHRAAQVPGGYQQPVATQVPGGYQQPVATQVPASKARVAPAAASKPQVTQTHTSGSSSPHRAAQVPGGYQQPVATQVPGGYQQPVATQVPASKARVAPAAASKPQVTQTHTSGSSSPHQAAQVSSGYQQPVATQVPASKARVAPAAASKPQVTQTRTTGSPTRHHKPVSSIAQTKHRGSKGKSKCSIM